MSVPAVIYAAKSTEDIHGSIPDQLNDCRAMAEREGWAVVDEFTDEGHSAWSGDRGQGLADARARAEAVVAEQGSCALVVQHTDRLARGDAVKATHLVEHYLWALKAGVRLRSVQDDSTGENIIMAAMMGERNAEDSRRKSEAVKGGLRRRAERGHHNGGPRPYGYSWEGPKGEGRLVAVPAEAAIVRRMFENYVAGHSQQDIQRALNAEGVPALRGGQWHQGTIARFLANPLYRGCVRLNGETHEGEHVGLVSAELWHQAAALREASSRTPGKGRGRRPKGSHLFVKGHLRCGQCGGAMIPTTKPTKTAGELYEVYECYTRKRGGSAACPQPPVKRASIDGAVIRYFEQSVLDVDATRDEIATIAQRKIGDIRDQRHQAEREGNEAKARLARVRRDYMDGKLSAEDWQGFRDDLEAEQEGARRQLAQLAKQEARVAKEAHDGSDVETLRYLTQIRAAVVGSVQDAEGVAAVRAALLQLFESFTLHPIAAGFDRDVFNTALMCVGPAEKYELEPTVREGAIAGYGPSGVTPLPTRVALRRASNKNAVGLVT